MLVVVKAESIRLKKSAEWWNARTFSAYYRTLGSQFDTVLHHYICIPMKVEFKDWVRLL